LKRLHCSRDIVQYETIKFWIKINIKIGENIQIRGSIFNVNSLHESPLKSVACQLCPHLIRRERKRWDCHLVYLSSLVRGGQAGRFVIETSFYFHCINCCLSFSLISGLPFGLVLDESDVPVPPSFQGNAADRGKFK